MANRKRLKNRYGALFSEISALLFCIDPVEINYGDNIDEYDSEVETVLTRLHSDIKEEEINGIVMEEFLNWFGKEEVDEIPENTWNEIASGILAIITKNEVNQLLLGNPDSAPLHRDSRA